MPPSRSLKEMAVSLLDGPGSGSGVFTRVYCLVCLTCCFLASFSLRSILSFSTKRRMRSRSAWSSSRIFRCSATYLALAGDWVSRRNLSRAILWSRSAFSCACLFPSCASRRALRSAKRAAVGSTGLEGPAEDGLCEPCSISGKAECIC